MSLVEFQVVSGVELEIVWYKQCHVNGAVAPAADLIVCQLGISIEITMGVLWTVKVCRIEEGEEVCDDSQCASTGGH